MMALMLYLTSQPRLHQLLRLSLTGQIRIRGDGDAFKITNPYDWLIAPFVVVAVLPRNNGQLPNT